jgi:hypothetical protein
LLILEKIAEAKELLVKWYYHDYDEDMQQNGQRFASLVNVNFEFIEIKDEV